MEKFIVYCYTNTINNKKYIGLTKQTLKKRAGGINGYRYKRCRKFYAAIKKYGFKTFTGEILFSNLTQQEAKQKEIELIEEYNTTDRNYGYNISKGGDYSCSSQESKNLVSKANKNKHLSPKTEFKKGMIPWNKGKKMRDIKPDYIPPYKGKHLSEEAKQKISAKNKGRENPRKEIPLSQEAKDNLALKNTGKKASLETKQKMSETWKRKYSDPDYRDRRLEIARNTHHKGTPVSIYCLELDKVFVSCKEAVQELNLCSRSLTKCLSGYQDICNGYHFEYCDESRKLEANKNREARRVLNKKINKCKPVQCIELGLNFISCLEAARYLGKKFGSQIAEVCHGQRKTAYGYHWKFIDKGLIDVRY